MSTSIRRRLILYLLIPFLLLRVLNAAYDYYVNVADARLVVLRQLSDTARVIASGLTSRDGQVDPAYAIKVVEPLVSRNVVRYSIRSGEVLIAGERGVPTLPTTALNESVFGETQLEDRLTPLVTYKTTIAGHAVTIDLAAGVRSDVEATRRALWRDLLWNFFELDISLLFIWFGVSMGLRPLDSLRNEVDNRSAHDLSLLDAKGRPRELAPLIRSLNRLFETLSSLLAAQQQFISNAAHQLRTPIAGMTAQLDLLKSEPLADSLKQRFDTLSRGMRSLGRAANQLLTLARVDSAAATAERKGTSELSIVIASVVGRFIDRAVAANIDLSVDTTPTKVRGDSGMLEELLSNLVDNALKYTPHGGAIVIHCGNKDGMQYLAVEDTGPGIPVGERRRVFERFYRTPGATGEGTGLGLAIAEEIARASRATIAVDSGAQGKGTRIEVRWQKFEPDNSESAAST